MKKIAILLAIAFASSTFASDACFKSCDSANNQNGLMCQKIMQICMRMGPAGSEGSDMCFEDYQFCQAKGLDAKRACYEACEEQE